MLPRLATGLAIVRVGKRVFGTVIVPKNRVGIDSYATRKWVGIVFGLAISFSMEETNVIDGGPPVGKNRNISPNSVVVYVQVVQV